MNCTADVMQVEDTSHAYNLNNFFACVLSTYRAFQMIPDKKKKKMECSKREMRHNILLSARQRKFVRNISWRQQQCLYVCFCTSRGWFRNFEQSQGERSAKNGPLIVRSQRPVATTTGQGCIERTRNSTTKRWW